VILLLLFTQKQPAIPQTPLIGLIDQQLKPAA
jgi:hypothetical protein